MQEINKSIIEADTKYICHQCNCLTNHSAGLALAIFNNFPYANIYKIRPKQQDWKQQVNILGTINVAGNGEDQRFVINMLAQLFPGKSKYPNSKIDGVSAREEYFKMCLEKINKIPNLETIAFPEKIGCTMAGGNWEKYREMIQEFDSMTNAEVFLYNYQNGSLIV